MPEKKSLTILRTGYRLPYTDVGIVELTLHDTWIETTITNFESFMSADAAIQALATEIRNSTVVSVGSFHTRVLTGPLAASFNPMEAQSFNDMTAMQRFGGTSLLLATSSKVIVNTLPGQSVLSDAACYATVIQSAYEKELRLHPRAAALILSENQVDLLIFENGVLTGHQFDNPESDRESFIDAADDLLEEYAPNLGLLLLLGASPWLNATEKGFLSKAAIGQAEVRVIDPDRYLKLHLTDRDAQQEAADPKSRFSPIALPTLFAGAALCVAKSWGADFRGVLGVDPQVTPAKSLWEKIEDQAQRWLPGPKSKGGKFLGLGLGAALAVGYLGIAGGNLWLTDTATQQELVREEQRERDNQGFEAEAKALQAEFQALKKRTEVINRVKASQPAPYQIADNLQLIRPSGVILTKVAKAGREITVEGYVTPTTVAMAQSVPPGAPPPPNLAVDVLAKVVEYRTKIEADGRYANVVSNYKGMETAAEGPRGVFTIKAVYKGEFVSETIQLPPLPKTIERAAGAGAPPTAKPEKE